MRALILASAVGLAFAASTQAAPVWRNTAEIELGAAPFIELVRDGCGRGWHRTRWRDQWGIWRWGDCVPNEGGYTSQLPLRWPGRGLVRSLSRVARCPPPVGFGLSVESVVSG